MLSDAISAYMTPNPVCVQRTATIAQAWRLMTEKKARHLPVIDGERLVGVLSQRDLLKLETVVNVDRMNDPVSDAMSNRPYAVSPQARLDEVVLEMARHKMGCAVVARAGQVLGVFTTTDALRALAGFIEAARGEPIGGRALRAEPK